MVFMVKQPIYLALSPLVLDPTSAMHFIAREAPEPWRKASFHFRCNFANCHTAADVEVGDGDDVQVLFGLRYDGGTRISTTQCPMGLAYLLSGSEPGHVCEQGDAGQELQPPEKADEHYEKLLQVMPWLELLDEKQGFMGSTSSKAKSSGGGGGSGHHDDRRVEIDEDELLAGLADLEKARASAVDEHAATSGGRDFVPRIRGGESQIAKSGEAVHASQAQTTTKAARKWATDNSLQVTFKATFSEHGPHAARVLTRSWCHRMQFFYDMMLAHECEADFEFTPERIASYIEPAELTALAHDASVDAWLSRIAQTRWIPFR